MSLLSVDKEKCISDGACVAICPLNLISMDNDGRLPTVAGNIESLCINCGHCVAVCPQGALSLSAMSQQACRPLPADWMLSPVEIEYLLKGRRSIRTYKDKAVDRAVLEKMIDIARYAPSGINRQPVCWAVVCQKEKVRGLTELVVDWMRAMIKNKPLFAESLRFKNLVAAWESGSDRICRNAPHIIITYALGDDMTAPAACTIALTYLELTAVSFGLGACWAGYAQMAINMSADVQKFLGLSQRSGCFGAMMVGYPKYNYFRIPLRNKPRILWR